MEARVNDDGYIMIRNFPDHNLVAGVVPLLGNRARICVADAQTWERSWLSKTGTDRVSQLAGTETPRLVAPTVKPKRTTPMPTLTPILDRDAHISVQQEHEIARMVEADLKGARR